MGAIKVTGDDSDANGKVSALGIRIFDFLVIITIIII